MSEDRFEPTPWWDAEDERPVPLGAEASWAAPDEAELIVNAEREAIIREDTEPNLVTLAQLAAVAQPQVRQSEGLAVRRSAALAAVALLLVGCVAMFALGWSRGQEVVATSVGSRAVSESTSHESANGSLMSSSRINQVGRKGGEG